MSEKQTDFCTLSEAVIAELKSLGYMDSSLINYRRLYVRLDSFMQDHSIKKYSPAVGKAFLAEYYPCDNDRRRMVLLMIRRLDDHLNSPYIFSDKELELIFASADNTTVRDKKACIYLPIEFPVILRLLFCCGLRIGETVRIKMKEADLENGVLKLVNTKGDKHRLVPMTEKMTDILTKYCLAMGLVGNGEAWLFPGNDKNDHISDRSVKHRFERILKDNGVELKNRKNMKEVPVCIVCGTFSLLSRSDRQKSSECH